MSWNYFCPDCGAMLNPDRTIILTACRRGKHMLIGFHPEPGNYTLYVPPGIEVVDGDRWEFFCPVCHVDLVTTHNDNLCALKLGLPRDARTVLFSRIAGEKVTFVVSHEGVDEHHGSHADSYLDHIGGSRYFF